MKFGQRTTVQLIYGNDLCHKRRPISDDHHSRTVLWSCADFQRPSSTNENEITSRTQYTLDFHHVPRSFGYIKQVEKRTCQREAFLFVFWSWFRFFLRPRRRRRSLYYTHSQRVLVVVTRIYNDKDTKQHFKFQTFIRNVCYNYLRDQLCHGRDRILFGISS